MIRRADHPPNAGANVRSSCADDLTPGARPPIAAAAMVPPPLTARELFPHLADH